MALTKYNQKRKFSQTPEPKGKLGKKQGGKTSTLRFVIQKHQASRLHYDFRLEHKGAMLSWAVPKGPSLNPDDKRLAMMVEDHPMEYNKFEGTIPEKNYGAGTVMIWDQGNFLAIETKNAAESEKAISAGLAKGHITFVINGEKVKGEFALIKIKSNPYMNGGKNSGENAWLLVKADDQYVDKKKDITKQDRSVVSGRSMEQIAKGLGKGGKKSWISNREVSDESEPDNSESRVNIKAGTKAAFPHDIKPELATLTDKPFNDSEYIFEIKWDGYRAITELEKGKVRLYSRNGLSFNEMFAPVVESLKKIKHNLVLDGEVCAIDSRGRPSFQLLQNYQDSRGKADRTALAYFVFDILYMDGYKLVELPLTQRREILEQLTQEFSKAKHAPIKISEVITEQGVNFYKAAEAQGLEGIMAKKSNSVYRTGRRTREWLKIKTHMRQEAVICGFTEPRGGRKDLGALVLGVYNNSKLVYIGHTGGGFNDKSLREMREKLTPLIQAKSPFKVAPKTNAPVKWVKPVLVCEVQFSNWTSDGQMRQPIFQGLRKDKKAKDVSREKAVKLT